MDSICSVLESISEDDIRVQWLEVSLAVCSRIMFVNSTAFIHKGLGEQILRMQDILTAIDNGSTSKRLYVPRRYLGHLLRRLETGAQLPPARQPKLQQNEIVSFAPPQESPGGRHDNDHTDFSSIQILPTVDEILSAEAEYLPERDPSRWQLSGLAGLLDRNFRLLREDSVGQLRDAVRQAI
ncbi:uncharacterized protein BJX67DRAFT_246486 [Aspergillus lucknowensis]|uniref:Uncharacterized protein n=1 Tax=Aspergillus lucknowensis TaxID=176173 RepID=A0ABR4M1R1_9EURO